MQIIDEIINLYEGSNKDLAIQASKYLLEFGMKSLPPGKIVQKQPAKIEKIQKDIQRLLLDRGIKNTSFSVSVDNNGFVSFI